MIYNTSTNIFFQVLNVNHDVTLRKNDVNIFELPPSWVRHLGFLDFHIVKRNAPVFLSYLTIRPIANKGYGSISPHGLLTRGEGPGLITVGAGSNNGFSIIQQVGQKRQ